MADAMRVVVGVLGALMIVGGIVAIAVGVWPAGVWGMTIGVLAIAAALLERMRYRSEAAEGSVGAHGPGGSELSMPEAPFQPTDEVFVDPTSKQRLRVYLNPATGERRYYADEARAGG
jgi:hypothetical protein